MKLRLARGVGGVSLAIALLGPGAAPAAPPLPPAELLVEGGGETWHPKRRFRILWRNPAAEGAPAIAAIHYRVLGPTGTVAIAPVRIDWPVTSIEGLEVPNAPGAYTAEVWLEDAAGGIGAPAAAKLRFDSVRPGEAVPSAAATWIGRAAFPLTIRLSHPGGELPVSGIRGYALSVAPAPGRGPCEAPDRCSNAETDLRGGIGDDSYTIADLPEGTSYVEAVAVSGSGMASATPGRLVLRVDETSPLVRLSGVPEGWVQHPVELTAIASDGGSGMAAEGDAPAPFTAIAIDGSAPKTAAGSRVSATAIEEGVHRIAYYARDLAGNVDDGGETNGLANRAPPTVLVRIDHQPPSVSFVNSQDPSQPELIGARVADSMSGPDPGRGWIGVRRAGSGDRFGQLPPLPAPSGELRARWDSDDDPAGDYEFRALAFDRAGNVTVARRRANGEPMLLSNPLKAATALRARLGGRSHGWQAVPFGRAVRFKGHLATGVSAPLSGMRVRVVERFSAPAPTRISTVKTGPAGGFAVLLPAGPSREVTAHFDGTPTLGRSSTPILRLGVRAGMTMQASSPVARVGGRPIVFRGKVAAAPGTIPSSGKSVQLQFRLPGLRWSEFRTIQTDRRGRFSYAYRFSDDDSRGALFQFRAYAPPQTGWPYEPGGSRPVVVRGR